MLRILTLALLLVACSQPRVSGLLEDRVGHELQLDMSACQAAAGAATFDGASWRFTGVASIRCPLPIEGQDWIQSYTVYGWHAGPGPVRATACVQIRELGGPAGAPPYDAQPCAEPLDVFPQSLWLRAIPPPPGFGISEDFSVSLRVTGGAGDSFGGASLEILRLH